MGYTPTLDSDMHLYKQWALFRHTTIGSGYQVISMHLLLDCTLAHIGGTAAGLSEPC